MLKITPRLLLWLVAGVACPSFAWADEPAPSAQTLATVEAILERCAVLSPADAQRYRELVRMIAPGASEDTLAKLRKSDEYRTLHDQMLESLANVGEADARASCEQFLPRGR